MEEYRILTKEEYYSNLDYYQTKLEQILQTGFSGIDLDNFFHIYPIHTIALLIKDNAIVSLIIAYPDAVFDTGSSNILSMDTSFWRIEYILTHSDYRREGYAKKLLLFTLKDMVLKGANKFDGFYNGLSTPLIKQIAEEYGLDEEIFGRNITLLDIDKVLNKKL